MTGCLPSKKPTSRVGPKPRRSSSRKSNCSKLHPRARSSRNDGGFPFGISRLAPQLLKKIACSAERGRKPTDIDSRHSAEIRQHWQNLVLDTFGTVSHHLRTLDLGNAFPRSPGSLETNRGRGTDPSATAPESAHAKDAKDAKEDEGPEHSPQILGLNKALPILAPNFGL